MADDFLAIADLIGDAFDLADVEISDLLKRTPLLDRLMLEESSNGTTHKYVKETGAPVVGFRSPNAGRDMDHSEDTAVSVDLKYLDFSWQVDVATARAWRKGKENLIAREGLRHIQAALVKFEQVVINGTLGIGDSAGFNGFRNATTIDALADATHVVNAAGTTANTGSSVYAVKLGKNDVSGVYKGDGPAIELGETIAQQVVDGDGKHYHAYCTDGGMWLALQVGSAYSLSRIVNLTADSGKGLTDTLLSQLLELCPAGHEPDVLVMSRRSRGQLQRSRTTYSPTGAPAPIPQEYEGIPIVVTEAVSNTEALLAA